MRFCVFRDSNNTAFWSLRASVLHTPVWLSTAVHNATKPTKHNKHNATKPNTTKYNTHNKHDQTQHTQQTQPNKTKYNKHNATKPNTIKLGQVTERLSTGAWAVTKPNLNHPYNSASVSVADSLAGTSHAWASVF